MVNVSRAEAAFGAGRFVEAARVYGQVAASTPSFEELALKFVDAGVPEALQEFLKAKLEALGPEDKAQVASLSSLLPLQLCLF